MATVAVTLPPKFGNSEEETKLRWVYDRANAFSSKDVLI